MTTDHELTEADVERMFRTHAKNRPARVELRAFFAPVLDENDDEASDRCPHRCGTVEHWAILNGQFCQIAPLTGLSL